MLQLFYIHSKPVHNNSTIRGCSRSARLVKRLHRCTHVNFEQPLSALSPPPPPPPPSRPPPPPPPPLEKNQSNISISSKVGQRILLISDANAEAPLDPSDPIEHQSMSCGAKNPPAASAGGGAGAAAPGPKPAQRAAAPDISSDLQRYRLLDFFVQSSLTSAHPLSTAATPTLPTCPRT